MAESGFADEDEDAWDSIAFNTVVFEQLPIKVSGQGIRNKLDVKDPKGADGTSVTPRGSSAREFKIQLSMFRRDHRRALEALLPLISARASKTKAQPVVITYPSLALVGISQAWVSTGEIPEGDGTGIFSITFDCIEYQEPRKTGTKTAKPQRPLGSRIIDETRGLTSDTTGRKIDLDNVPASMFRDDLIPPFKPNFDP